MSLCILPDVLGIGDIKEIEFEGWLSQSNVLIFSMINYPFVILLDTRVGDTSAEVVPKTSCNHRPRAVTPRPVRLYFGRFEPFMVYYYESMKRKLI
jgi:hypothetical protein